MLRNCKLFIFQISWLGSKRVEDSLGELVSYKTDVPENKVVSVIAMGLASAEGWVRDYHHPSTFKDLKVTHIRTEDCPAIVIPMQY